ncbi:uncharacterized protein LOC133841061 [Drosophila sulfurigaster albostrigata]|uniref:uncharacterized protein LOC133841061 n=1 Tax=Drosophila sulfurigaster albostrigata TaxID=89887 RepID=UPI002D21B8A1|nr:uncharacterized protein LOC133841061 [Drosophila sulfurigaster albostrigata]
MDQEIDLELSTKSSQMQQTNEVSLIEDLSDNNLTNESEQSEEVEAPDTSNVEQERQDFLEMIEQKLQLLIMREELALHNDEGLTAIDSDEDFVAMLLADHISELERDELAMDLIHFEEQLQSGNDEETTPRGSQQAQDQLIEEELKVVAEESQIQLDKDEDATPRGSKLEHDEQTELDVKPESETEMKSDFVAQLLVDILLPTTDSSTSDVVLKQNEPHQSEGLASCESSITEVSSTFGSTLSDSFSLQNLLDTSGEININWPEGHESYLTRKILSVLQNEESYNIKVYIGTYKFHCQLDILQMYSSCVLPKSKQTPYKMRLPEDEVTPDAFKAIYNWMTHDAPVQMEKFNKRSLIEFYKAAKYLSIAELNDAICDILDKIRHEGEAFDMLLAFARFGLTDFEQLFLSRISRFFLTIVSSLEFMELSLSSIRQLLSSSFLGVNSEIEVFYAAVRWLSHNWPQRRFQTQDVVSCVRFNLLPPMFLRFLQEPQNTQVMDCIASSSLVKKMINQAFVYTSAELYSQDPKDHLMLHLHDYVATVPRKWLFDPKCSYHTKITCNLRQTFSYEQFLEYLEMLQHNKPEEWQELKYLNETTISC